MMAQNVAALVSSKICHDLINPIGAIGNGIELMTLASGHNVKDEIELIAASAESASSKLQFFRLVYGNSKVGQLITRQSAEQILDASQHDARFQYVWKTDDRMDRRMLRVALLAIQCLETAASGGGEITINQAADRWSVILNPNGPLKIDERLWSHLTNQNTQPELTSAEVQFALAPQVAAENNRALSVAITEMIEVTF